MRRLAQLVLLALVMQFTGMAGFCAPPQAPAAHDCCTPSSEKDQAHPQTTMPECCFVTAFHEQGSLGQRQTTSEDVAPDVQLAPRRPLQPIPAPNAHFDRTILEHPVSPPFDPLKQSCLLLI
jgi:hypothetical protein